AIITNNLSAQNIGIGTTLPTTKLHVTGSLVITEPTYGTSILPTPAQTLTLVNATNIVIPQGDSTGYIYDPGGSAGNYTASQTATLYGNPSSFTIGWEITFSDMDLNTGDSLTITDLTIGSSPLFAVGNGYNATPKIIINVSAFNLTFKSNSDGNVGRGFALKFRRLYSTTTQLPNMMGITGSGLYYDVKKSAFRAGKINNFPVGLYSFGGGYNPIASGVVSFAMGSNAKAVNDYTVAIGDGANASGFGSISIGRNTNAIGSNSTALGYNTNANGVSSSSLGYNTAANGGYSTALGSLTTAEGDNSTAMGYNTTANGQASTAMGFNTTSSGNYSTAMGYGSSTSGTAAAAIGYNVYATANNSIALGSYANTNGKSGSFVMADNSTTTYLNSNVPNGFVARFAAGYGLYTSANQSTGVWVAAGGNSWMTISDRRLKENFIPVDGENILKCIASMPQYTWNYKTQDPKTFRHYGPMAQDFFKAFGKDELGTIGCDSMINQHDFLGVNFIAIQALVVRSDKLEAENKMLKDKLSMIEQKLSEMEKRGKLKTKN
ncbi:MAG TPA: tail fiber domain-containing protein, partial [Ferruginibacter sp.]|nr:tail fiber domain-containing protein [Ferruginibacter sp.]